MTLKHFTLITGCLFIGTSAGAQAVDPNAPSAVGSTPFQFAPPVPKPSLLSKLAGGVFSASRRGLQSYGQMQSQPTYRMMPSNAYYPQPYPYQQQQPRYSAQPSQIQLNYPQTPFKPTPIVMPSGNYSSIMGATNMRPTPIYLYAPPQYLGNYHP